MTVKVVETVAIGLAAGFLSGMFGVGGGILFVPALIFIAGLSQIEATATSLAAMIPVVLVGTWRQNRYGNVNRRAALTIGLTSAVGIVGGTAVAERISEDLLRQLFAALLLLSAARLIWSALRSSPSGPAEL